MFSSSTSTPRWRAKRLICSRAEKAAEVVAFRPVKVYSEDYAEHEYGVTGEQLDQFAERMNKELDAERKAGRLKPFTGKLKRG